MEKRRSICAKSVVSAVRFTQEADVRNARHSGSGTPEARKPIRIGMTEQLQNGESIPSPIASANPGAPCRRIRRLCIFS